MTHQLYQLSRMIERQGQACRITRPGENEFHEPTGETEVCRCKGLFHEANEFLNVSTVDAGRIYAQKEPRLLILFSPDIQKEDDIKIAGNKFRIIGIDDLGNLHLCQ